MNETKRTSGALRERPKPWQVGVLLTALLVPGVVAAVPVTGRVQVTGSLGEGARVDRQNWEVPNGVVAPNKDELPLERELAVVLVGATGVREPSGCAYTLRGGDFSRRTMVASVGGSLKLSNRDGCTHELVAEGLSALKGAALGPGQTVEQAVSAPGHFVIRDRLYAHIEGHLHVVAGLASCGDVSNKGVVRFGDVPPGPYELKVFRGPKELASRKVEVTNRRDVTLPTVEVKLAASK